MRILHYLAWFSFVGVFLFDVWQYIDIHVLQHIHADLFGLSLASREKGLALLDDWSRVTTRTGASVLDAARLNTRWDYLFIFGYVCVLVILSYSRMQREPRPWLNTLLRLNFLLAFLAGLLDAIENAILLTDMAPCNIGNTFFPSRPFSLAKFILGAWAVLVLLFSVTTSRLATGAPISPPEDLSARD
ncbi:MAG TPA: hypothetical protein VHE54_04800 [Puia sp.]|nr:hypothetical protein [Puia sp.]